MLETLICCHCKEEILPPELLPSQINDRNKTHRECMLRMIAGSIAHQCGTCRCYGGSGEDDPNLSVRENARRAAAYFVRRSKRAAQATFN